MSPACIPVLPQASQVRNSRRNKLFIFQSEFEPILEEEVTQTLCHAAVGRRLAGFTKAGEELQLRQCHLFLKFAKWERFFPISKKRIKGL